MYGTLESDKPLDDLRDTLRKNFKITFILEGLSLKLVRIVREKPYKMNLKGMCREPDWLMQYKQSSLLFRTMHGIEAEFLRQ